MSVQFHCAKMTRLQIWIMPFRERLKQLNTDALKMVDSAIFCLVLEDKPIHLDDPEDIVSTFLHGNGSSRWFDKSFSLIVASNGHLALNFEHAWGDGMI